MFTGLIRELAQVLSYQNNILTLKANYNPAIGDSVAVNGVCLTVISVHEGGFALELADETRKIIDLERLAGKVHIEPAMSMSERFDGHFVQGHVDTVGEVAKITRGENGVDFYIKVDTDFLSQIVPKGSIAIDGVSLTVNEVYSDSFRLTIIPHTIKNTLMQAYKPGSRVNIETDMFAKYIDHMLAHRQKPKQPTWADIDKKAFLY
ncbi:MAG: riboflavin synthase [Campylobacterota bacterium]